MLSLDVFLEVVQRNAWRNHGAIFGGIQGGIHESIPKIIYRGIPGGIFEGIPGIFFEVFHLGISGINP